MISTEMKRENIQRLESLIRRESNISIRASLKWLLKQYCTRYRMHSSLLSKHRGKEAANEHAD